MIRYHIPAEYADAVQAALTPCSRCWSNAAVPHHGSCKNPPSFWWGITGEMCHTPTCSWGTSQPTTDDCRCKGIMQVPLRVQQMLDPCQTCDADGVIWNGEGGSAFTSRCPDCRDGRPLVELVTDCPEPGCGEHEVGHVQVGDDDDGDSPVAIIDICPECDGDGTVSLGVVTADPKVLPVADGNLSSLSRPCVAVADDGTAYLFTSNGNDDDPPAPIALLGPLDATHAIHLTGVPQ